MDAPLEGVFARDADRFFERADDAVTDPIARVAVRGEKMFARSVARCVGEKAGTTEKRVLT